MEETLNRPDFHHISYRLWFGEMTLWAYKRDPESPSCVSLIDAWKEDDAAVAILAKYNQRAQAAGQMGRC